jgi:mono/diheme cytochrome c family protein
MKLCRTGLAVFLAVTTVVLPGFSERPLVNDPAAGKRLAIRWCASCHLVQPGQPQANADVRSFSEIARTPDFSPDRVAMFLQTPHPHMPSYSLSRIEARAIAAYIESLATPAR